MHFQGIMVQFFSPVEVEGSQRDRVNREKSLQKVIFRGRQLIGYKFCGFIRTVV